MSSTPQPPTRPDKPLPKVEPPNGAFLIQLFVTPMIIVGVFVLGWWLLNSVFFGQQDPYQLVVGIERMNDATWQKASTFADMLRNPRYAELKEDDELARRLAETLDRQLESDNLKPQAIKMRMFLARALGEFHSTEGLPVLIEAATVERDANEPRDPDKPWFPKEVDVRRAALEAIAVLAGNVGAEELRGNEKLLAALRDASNERALAEDIGNERASLRQTSAYTLGVIGGEPALDRLEQMLADPHPNARYNAATGLARHGDMRGAETLAEMLDPENDRAADLAQRESGRQWNRSLVLVNGIRAVEALAAKNKAVEDSMLMDALHRLSKSPEAPRHIRNQAELALKKIQDAPES